VRTVADKSVSRSTERADKIVVLDRDGTIVVDRDYLADPEALEFLPGAAEGLRHLHRRGYRLVIISNQSGIARGLFSLERLEQINARLIAMARGAGADIAGIYCCPHSPEQDCNCRKPKPALLLQAARELGFEPARAVVVGDKASDVELGRRVGARTVLISSATQPDAASSSGADHIARDLREAARFIEALTASRAAGAASRACT
jgi:D-glycero-D-manno-heptose 1,7-bisphosphate phosphatase